MKNKDSSANSRCPRGLNDASRFFIIFLIFCIVECATSSCLSYGHSCWGAHGKRTYNWPRIQENQQIARDVDRPVAEVKNNGNPATKCRTCWFISRLINEQLALPEADTIIDKIPSNRWHEGQNILGLPGNQDNDYDTTWNQIFRNEKIDRPDSIEDSTDLDDSIELTEKMVKPDDDISELLFVPPSRNDYDNHRPSRTRKLRLYKILADSSNDALK